ncbi:MAG: FKBP-type peptidyl-prolyl cis-trans isomerase [archaeon]
MAIKKGDYIEVKYVGRLPTRNLVFDVNDEELAKKNNVYDSERKYKHAIVKVGESDILQGLDESLEGKEIGKTYTVEIPDEKAFGKKDVKLIKLIPASKFREQKIQPHPGMQVNVDNNIGIIKTVSSGRILVDFNHPLSSHDLSYEVTIVKTVSELKKQVEGYLELSLQLPEVDIEIVEGILKIKLGLPPQLKQPLLEQIQKRFPEIKDIEIVNK